MYLNFGGVNKTNRIEGGVVECVYTIDVCKLLAALLCTSSALGALGVATVERHAGISASSGLETCSTSGWSCRFLMGDWLAGIITYHSPSSF